MTIPIMTRIQAHFTVALNADFKIHSNQPFLFHFAQSIVNFQTLFKKLEVSVAKHKGRMHFMLLNSADMMVDLAQLVGVFVVSSGVHVSPTPVFVINQSERLKKFVETAYCVAIHLSESGPY